MPDLLLHLIVPFAALLLFYKSRYRVYIVLLSPLAILPDVDHLWSGEVARAWLHNIFILVPPLLVGIYGYKTRQEKLYNIAFIAAVYLCSHILLDIFQGGVSLIYPIANYDYAVTFDLFMQNHTITPDIAFNVSLPSRSANTGVEGDVITSVTVATAVIFLSLAALQQLLKKRP